MTWQEITDELGIGKRQLNLTVAFIREYNVIDEGLRFVTESWQKDYRYRIVETSLEVEEYVGRRYDWMTTAIRRVAHMAAVNARQDPDNTELQLFALQARRLHEDVERLGERTSRAASTNGSGNGNGNGVEEHANGH